MLPGRCQPVAVALCALLGVLLGLFSLVLDLLVQALDELWSPLLCGLSLVATGSWCPCVLESEVLCMPFSPSR